MVKFLVSGRQNALERRSKAAVAALMLAPFCSACGLIIGADEYSATHSPEAEITEAAYRFFSAALPAEQQEDCENCMREHCRDLVESCPSDENCRSTVTCFASLESFIPPTFDACLERPEPGEPAGAFVGRIGSQINACGSEPEHCEARCAIGREFDCSGNYDWPSAESSSVPITVQVFEEDLVSPVPSVEVRLCARVRNEEPDEECSAELDVEPTDPDGIAVLTSRTIVGLDAADAYILVGKTETTEKARVYFNRPWYAPPPFTVVAVAQPLGRAVISGIALTCRGNIKSARGVNVTLARADGLDPGVPELFPMPTDASGGFLFADVEGILADPPASTIATLHVEDAATGTPLVDGFEFPIGGGATTTMLIWPDASNYPP